MFIYAAGAPIFHEGESGTCAYLIERGQIEISKRVDGTSQVLAVLGPGELFGEMAPIDGERRSATARALSEAEVIPISRTQLEGKIDDADPLVRLLLRLILNRLRSTQRGASLLDGPIARPKDLAYETARARAIEQIQMGRALQEAIDHRQFELFYQPVVSCDGGQDTAGLEALLRWHRPEWGLLQPADFIPLAEETGLIVPIGLWVIETACRALVKFQKQFARRFPNAPPLFMCVNVSARQLCELAEVDRMVQMIERSDADPAHIKLEITEGMLLQYPEAAAAGLRKLKGTGVTLAVDDFGTGYSSLSYLHRFQFDTLKVDSSFVSSMLYNDDSLHIVRAITSLARELKMDVIAEGVEDNRELQRLRELRCGYAQGFLFSRPVPESQILERLRSTVTPRPTRRPTRRPTQQRPVQRKATLGGR